MSFLFFSQRSGSKIRLSAAALVGCWLGWSGVPAHGDTGEAYPTIENQLGRSVQNHMSDHDYPGMTIAASMDGRMVMNRAYGVSDTTQGTPMSIDHRTRIGSLSKLMNAATFLRYTEDSGDPGLLDQPVFGINSLLSPGDFPELYDAFNPGILRQTPVVGTVISKVNDRVYTYYDNGTYSIGNTSDLDAYTANNLLYTLPPGKTPGDIVGMAGSKMGGTFTWYRDETVSCGTFEDLRSPEACYFENVELPEGQQMSFMVGAAVSGTSGLVYSWWEDGTRSVGGPLDLAAIANKENQPYTVNPNHGTLGIRSLGISKSDGVYTFYSDNKVTKGTSTDLDRWKNPYNTTLAAGITAQPWLSWYGDITPRHLLSHSSGIQRNISLTGATVMDTGQLADDGADGNLGFAKLQEYGHYSGRFLFSPGSSSTYSNHAAALAGFVLETQSGQTFKDLLDSTILDPAGVTMRRAWDPENAEDSRPHVVKDNQIVPCNCDVIWRFREQSGYLTSTAGDFLRVLLTMDGEGSDVLSPASVQLMETRAPGSGFGLGWSVSQSGRMLSHGGAVLGGSATVYRFKPGHMYEGQDLGGIQVVVAANIWNSEPAVSLSTLALKIAKAIAAADAIEPIPESYDLN